MTTERVGRYQLLEPIGVGPTGSVSRAKVFGVAGFERQFAIKRFHADLTSVQATAQALSTAARAYGGLEHPRIARMSEFGIAQGTTFTAVEYVAGLDAMRLIAEARLANTTLAAGGALALVSQAARAIGYAHGRGLTHLGLSPTNVVITPEGDVKITDFGILAVTLTPRPVEVPRLATRIGYLAPEQIANEATSAATDVFALGVLAYELVTGQPAFEGDTAADVAKAVAGKPPAEPSLPRPIVRVLQRCIARSPFERFPDARALADALDAALRVAPVPGTRKDIGAQVKATLDRLADLHSGEVSGMLSFNVGAVATGPLAQVATLGVATRDSAMDVATMEFVRPDTPVAGPTPLVGPASRPTHKPGAPDDNVDAGDTTEIPSELPTMPSLARTSAPLPKIPIPSVKPTDSKVPVPPHTVPGLAPPPIPSPPTASMSIPKPGGPTTLAGLSNPSAKVIPKPLVGAVPPPKPGQGPTRPVAVRVDEPPERPSETPVSPLKMMAGAPSGSAVAVPLARITPVPPQDPKKQLFGALRPDTDAPGAARTDLVIETDPGEAFELGRAELPTMQDRPGPSLSVEMEVVHAPDDIESAVDGPADRPTNEMSPLLREHLAREASRSDPMPQSRSSLEDLSWPNELPQEPQDLLASPLEGPPVERKTLAGFQPSRSLAAQRPMNSSAGMNLPSERNLPTLDVRSQLPKRSKAPLIAAIVLGIAVLGAGGYVAYDLFLADAGSGSGSGSVAVNDPPKADAPTATTPDADAIATPDAAAANPSDATAAKPADAATATVADAGKATPADAAPVAADAKGPEPTASGDTFAITSTPPGARVFLDGSDAGTTPLKQPGTPDKHTIALFVPGHELYIAQVKGQGAYAIPLKEVTPSGGPAGIKVTKCAKDRYYVFVDGKPTGMLCPTERIEVDLGAHTVEIYDLQTETRRQFPVNVKDTRLSVRVRIE